MATKAFLVDLVSKIFRMAPWGLFCLMALPLFFVWPMLFIQTQLTLLSIPVSLVLHEWLHAWLLPKKTQFQIVQKPFYIALVFNQPLQSPLRALASAALPGMLLPLIGLWLLRWHPMTALPWLCHAFTLPFDLFEWYRMLLRRSH